MFFLIKLLLYRKMIWSISSITSSRCCSWIRAGHRSSTRRLQQKCRHAVTHSLVCGDDSEGDDGCAMLLRFCAFPHRRTHVLHLHHVIRSQIRFVITSIGTCTYILFTNRTMYYHLRPRRTNQHGVMGPTPSRYACVSWGRDRSGGPTRNAAVPFLYKWQHNWAPESSECCAAPPLRAKSSELRWRWRAQAMPQLRWKGRRWRRTGECTWRGYAWSSPLSSQKSTPPTPRYRLLLSNACFPCSSSSSSRRMNANVIAGHVEPSRSLGSGDLLHQGPSRKDRKDEAEGGFQDERGGN